MVAYALSMVQDIHGKYAEITVIKSGGKEELAASLTNDTTVQDC